MNAKRFILAAAVLFVFIFIYEYIVHIVFLNEIYLKTLFIWRGFSAMKTYISFNIFATILLSLWISFIFTRLFKEGGWKNGLLFGFYFGVLAGIQAAGAYYYLPISLTLAAYWFIAYVVEGLVGGFLVGVVYRK